MHAYRFLLITLGIILVSVGCRPRPEQVKRILKDHPEYIFEALESNPKRVAEMMQRFGPRAVANAAGDKPPAPTAAVPPANDAIFEPKIEADRAVLGKRNAPHKLVVYSDFQCPYCGVGYATEEKLRAKYGKDLLFVFKNFPLSFHPLAMPAAKRFEAIALQSHDKAYKFHDRVFEDQTRIKEGEKFLDEIATAVGANLAKMKTDMESETVKSRIEADMKEAASFGINGTPGYILNGKAIRGARTIESFEKIISERSVASH